jgi:anaerobic selenocysteine-containing dehydrogenase
MKIDRRKFIKALALASGGAVGLITSPLPWQVIRDLARWTQNWPWVPVPAQGKPSQEKTICGMCEGGCGLNVRKVGRRLVRIEGDKDHPVNRGSICPLGTASLQALYGPSRIKEPLKREGARGSGKWKPVSWEEAMAEVAEKVRALRETKESHALACITSSSESTVNQLFEHFLHTVGSRNYTRVNSGKDLRNIALKVMHGVDGNMAYDFENANLILSFGCSLLEGWGTCGRMYRTFSEWFADGESHAEIIQVEPNLSMTASKASQWAPIAVGTEAALALGIAHVLIRDSLYDQEFVEKHCFGFDDWKGVDGKQHSGFKSEVLTNYAPSSVEQITKAPAKMIEEIARRFGESESALAVCGKGDGDFFVDLYEVMAIHSLNALKGNINKQGGILVKPDAPLAPLPPPIMDEEAQRGYAVERLDGAGSAKYPFTPYLPGNLKAGKIKVLLIHEANPWYTLPDQQTTQEIFEKVPYIISFSPYMDESAARADLVLPLPTHFERWDDKVAAPELQYAVYNLTKPIVEPLYQTKNAGDALIELARQMGGTVAESFPWADMHELLKLRAQGLYDTDTGMINSPEAIATTDESRISGVSLSANYSSFASMWEKLLENRCWFEPKYKYDSPERILKTPSGRFEFYSQRLQKAFQFEEDIKCMPHYAEPAANPEGFELIIMPENMLVVSDNGRGTPPFLIKQLDDHILRGNDLFVQINPITAMYQGLRDGDSVILESPRGKVRVRLHTFEGIREGVALIPLGFGHTAFDAFIRGKGVNAQQIMTSREDSLTGLPIWWRTPGKIRKA